MEQVEPRRVPESTLVRLGDWMSRYTAPGMARLARHCGTSETPRPAATRRMTVGNCGASCTMVGVKPARWQQAMVRS